MKPIILLTVAFLMTLGACAQRQESFNSTKALQMQFTAEPLWYTALGKTPETEAWTAHTLTEIQNRGLSKSQPSDIEEFCETYPDLNESERDGFWLALVSAMVQRESSHDPSVSYQESFKDSTGEFVVSRGLLQLSRESANGYKCQVTEITLHDPLVNLSCGIKILSHWVSKDNVIHGQDTTSKKYRGGARYWSVLRPGKSLDFIKQKMNQLSSCIK